MTTSYHTARSIRDAVKLLSQDESLTPIAGGTDLIVAWRQGKDIKGFLDISQMASLKEIKEKKGWISIGATSSHSQIEKNPEVQKLFPCLALACRSIGAPGIRNCGTIGGNIMNASPASDSAVVLLAYDAALILESKDEAREIKISDFFESYRVTKRKNNELLTRILLPPVAHDERSVFLKTGVRKAQAIAKVNACFRIAFDSGRISLARIAFGSVAPVPVRFVEIEKMLVGHELTNDVIDAACNALANIIKPIDDIRSTADYRKHLAVTWLHDFLAGLIGSEK